MSAKAQAVGVLHLCNKDSGGNQVKQMQMTQRLMARASNESIWYGFVVVSAERESLMPGESCRVEIAFLDDVGARSEFAVDTVIHFGDGVQTRGTLLLDKYLSIS